MTRGRDLPESEPAGADAGSRRYATLPARVRPEDMTTAQAVGSVPSPTMGRDVEQDFLLRYGAG